MKLSDTIVKAFQLIGEIEQDPKKHKPVAGHCYFIDSENVLAMEKSFGNSRFPYSSDGLTVWANSSGNITVEESTLHIFPDSTEGREPRLAFFMGVKRGEDYFPISLTGAAKQLFEQNVKRYVLFSPYSTCYLTKTDGFECAVRVFVDTDKQIRFSVIIKNTSDDDRDIYASAYFNPLLQTSILETESKWFKASRVTEYGYRIDVSEQKSRDVCIERCLYIYRSAVGGKLQSTTAHSDFCGGYNNQLCNAIPLKTGELSGEPYTTFKETAIAGDMIKLTLASGESFDVSYTLAVGTSQNAEKLLEAVQTEEIDGVLGKMLADQSGVYKQIPAVCFEGMTNGIDDDVMNNFLTYVFRQVEFCARAKNYAGAYIGIRDIFQQLEAALIWIPEYSRKKIIEALGYIGDDGRAPRQYSYPAGKNDLPAMDLRPFVDQGNWIISTVYKYLAFTDDQTILDEHCGYYHLNGNTVMFSDRYDSVLEHLIAILDYLISNIDSDTGCLRALYGDWNDALDGLGRTSKGISEYGNGVSVMASLHLHQNLSEMIAILKKYGKQAHLIDKYRSVDEKLKAGLLKYGIDINMAGERKVIHGWGEDRAFKVGSFCDNDNISRDSLTVNAFWVLSGALEWDGTLRTDILKAYDRLEGKYGLKTFEPYFAKDNKDVGRIIKLPRGTAENAATYIHGTMFAVWSLFMIGEGERAWEQIYKLLPVTHSSVSTSPFVMPNSYIFNEDEALDGQSMSDWFTGSGCVLIKLLVQSVLGIMPDLDCITVAPAGFVPCKKLSVRLNVKGCDISLTYTAGDGQRRFIVNGQEVNGSFDEALQTEKIVLDDLSRPYVIEILG